MTVRTDPDFYGAARALLRAMVHFDSMDARVAILCRVARRLGDQSYPTFIKLICVVGESDDASAKQLLADTLAHAMVKGELPSGSLTSWGVGGNWIAPPPGVPGSFFRSVPRRHLGPIEYVSCWHGQSTNRTALSDEAYCRTLSCLLHLFDASPFAARTYQAKLAADSMTALEGTYTELTRARLAALAELWAQGRTPEAIASSIVEIGWASRLPGPQLLRHLRHV